MVRLYSGDWLCMRHLYNKPVLASSMHNTWTTRPQHHGKVRAFAGEKKKKKKKKRFRKIVHCICIHVSQRGREGSAYLTL